MENELKKRAGRNVRLGLIAFSGVLLLALGGGLKQPSQAHEALRARYRVVEPTATPTVAATATPTPELLQEIEEFGEEGWRPGTGDIEGRTHGCAPTTKI